MNWIITIHTLAGPFVTIIPDGDLNGTLSIPWVEKQILEQRCLILDDGSLWKSWNPDYIVAITQAPEICDDGKKTVKPIDAPGRLDPKKPGIVHAFRDTIAYLGQPQPVVILTSWDDRCTAYFMLYKIGGLPAGSVLNVKHFQPVIETWLKQTNGGYTGEYEVIVPHGIIDDRAEAETYVRDYIKETALEHKPAEKTGKAWQGWNEDRG